MPWTSTWLLASTVMHAQPSSPDFALLESLPYRSTLELDDCQDRAGRGTGSGWLPCCEHLARLGATTLIASEFLTNSLTEIDKVEWAAAPPPVRL